MQRFDRDKKLVRGRLVRMLANAERQDPETRLTKKIVLGRIERYIADYVKDENISEDRWLANYVKKFKKVYKCN